MSVDGRSEITQNKHEDNASFECSEAVVTSDKSCENKLKVASRKAQQ